MNAPFDAAALSRLLAFAQAASVGLEGSVAVFPGGCAERLPELVEPAGGSLVHVFGGSDVSPGALPPSWGAHEITDAERLPVDGHTFNRALLLPGALGAPRRLPQRLGELRRIVRPGGVVILATGRLARGTLPADRERPTLDQIQRALQVAGLVPAKVSLGTPPVRLTPADHRAALSELAVVDAMLLAVVPG